MDSGIGERDVEGGGREKYLYIICGIEKLFNELIINYFEKSTEG